MASTDLFGDTVVFHLRYYTGGGVSTAVLSECLESCSFGGQAFCTHEYINLVIASCTTSKTTAATHSPA